jgi:hypothetical protein
MARKKKKELIPKLIVPKNATEKQIHAAARAAVTADDLAWFARPIEELLAECRPWEEVLPELEEIQRRASRKRRKKK